MKQHVPASLNPAISNKFKERFRRHVFRLVYEGYVQLKGNDKDYSTVIEEDISHDLTEGIDCFLKADKSPPWVEKLSVQCEPPISPHGEVGRNRPRLDIKIRSGERPHCATFVFETKRLRHAMRPADYFGKEGIERFWNASGYPVNTYGEAGMLGYIQDEDTAHWISWLKERFEERRGALHTCKGFGWEYAIQVNELPETFCTCHQPSVNGEPIIIFHLLLLFC